MRRAAPTLVLSPCAFRGAKKSAKGLLGWHGSFSRDGSLVLGFCREDFGQHHETTHEHPCREPSLDTSPATLQRCQAEFAELLGDNLIKYYFFFPEEEGFVQAHALGRRQLLCFFLWKFIAYQPTSSKFDGSAGNLKRIVLLQTG